MGGEGGERKGKDKEGRREKGKVGILDPHNVENKLTPLLI